MMIKEKLQSVWNWTKNKARKFWKWVVVIVVGGVVLASAMGGGELLIPDKTFENLPNVAKEQGLYRITFDEYSDVEIGDKNMPEVKLRKWGDETFIKISYPDFRPVNPKQDKGKLKWVNNDKEVRLYGMKKGEILFGQELESDAFEFEIILKKKPASNVISLDIESKGLDFFYQPELTQEEIDNGAFRPENVIGSYAVYHKTKANYIIGQTNYKVGKAFHIYRPKIIDANGNEIWGELNITENNLTITIDQTWLDNAVYPVIVDPTFGYTTAGGTEYTNSSGGSRGKAVVGNGLRYVAGIGDTITKISISMASTDGTSVSWDGVSYDYSSNVPVNMVGTAQTITTTNQSQGWVHSNVLSEGLVDGTEYVVAMGYGTLSKAKAYYDSTSGNQRSYDDNSFGNPLQDPWVHLDYAVIKDSIYATYTVAVTPVVITNAVDEIQDTQADGNGNVTAILGTNITERGFVWDTASKADPGDVAPGSSGYANSVNEQGTYGTGVFSVTMTSLTEHVTYYVRAYAKNDDDPVEYGYGDEVTFDAGRIREVDTTDADFGDGSHTNTVAVSNNVELASNVYTQDFEGSFLPAGWTTGGNANWFKSSAQAHGGSNSAEGGNIGNNQNTWIDYDYTFSGDGELKFWWKVSSENNYDFLVYCEDIDGTCSRTTYTLRISGNQDWAQVTRNISSGAHSFRWMFAKDSSASSGSDTGWIDDIDIVITGADPYESSGNYVSDNLETNELSSVDDGHIFWTSTLNGQTLVVATNVSYNNGGAWQGWNNISSSGDVIPDIGGISVPADGLVKYRLTLSGNGTSTPQVHDVTIDREFEEAVEEERRIILIE